MAVCGHCHFCAALGHHQFHQSVHVSRRSSPVAIDNPPLCLRFAVEGPDIQDYLQEPFREGPFPVKKESSGQSGSRSADL